MKPLKLKIIVGSTRDWRFSEKILPWIEDRVKADRSFEYEVLDLRDYDMPLFNQKVTPSSKTEPYTNEAVARWTKKIADGDAFLFITPEYNRSIPGVLKNAFDWVNQEWGLKVAGFIGYGTVGGARAIEHMRLIAAEVQMATVQTSVHVFEHWLIRDKEGNIVSGSLDGHVETANKLLSQLSWWGSALRTARAAK